MHCPLSCVPRFSLLVFCLKMFLSVFVRETGLCFILISLSGLDVKVMFALCNEFGRLPSFLVSGRGCIWWAALTDETIWPEVFGRGFNLWIQITGNHLGLPFPVLKREKEINNSRAWDGYLDGGDSVREASRKAGVRSRRGGSAGVDLYNPALSYSESLGLDPLGSGRQGWTTYLETLCLGPGCEQCSFLEHV